jgi:DNA excision repair protein ERCC-2
VRYRTLVQTGAAVRVRLFCLDPSFLLAKALARGKGAVFFSATLSPTDYYRTLLGGEPSDPVLHLASPFPAENLALLVQDGIRTDYKSRGETLEQVAQAVAVAVRGRPGNYLVYFPSYQYLRSVLEKFQALEPNLRVLVQTPGMTEGQRDEFLAAFAADNPEPLVGFAVLGGVFGEGIDLVGDRLLGAIVVGVGLPQLCAERNVIRDYFQEAAGQGFEYAYTFPGMNRVLQATGRVIRSETDRGLVLLIDSRFSQWRYRCLFPSWWRPAQVRSVAQLGRAVDQFWT